MKPRNTTTGTRAKRASATSRGLGTGGKEITPPRAGITEPTTAAISPEERYRRIAEIAYRLAERRGFAPGGELDDWVRAEAEVDRRIGGGTG